MSFYHSGNRELQDQFGSRKLADRIEERLSRLVLTGDDCKFILERDMLFLATADAEGRPQCSYKGGEPGFVRAVDEQTLMFPNYDGNGMYLSAGNVQVNSHVGLLFIDFGAGRRMRVNGEASLLTTGPELAAYPEADGVWIVRVRQVFPNCSRYIHRYQLVERSPFVPKPECETPVPGWKKAEWARDVLPERPAAPRASQDNPQRDEAER